MATAIGPGKRISRFPLPDPVVATMRAVRIFLASAPSAPLRSALFGALAPFTSARRWSSSPRFLALAAGTTVAVASTYYEPDDSGYVDRLKRWREKHWNVGSTGWHRKEVAPHLAKHIGALLPDATAPSVPPKVARILVPLCGKTVDLVWLADLKRDGGGGGVEVVGVEGVDAAVAQFAAENWLNMRSQQIPNEDAGTSAAAAAMPAFVSASAFEGARTGYAFKTGDKGTGYYLDAAPATITVYKEARKPLSVVVGDFFELGPCTLGTFDAAWDRAALYALPKEARPEYVRVCDRLLAPGGRILLMALEYDQSKADGPPFCVPREEVEALYGPLGYTIQMLSNEDKSAEFGGPRWASAGPVREAAYLLTKPGSGASTGGGWWRRLFFWRRPQPAPAGASSE